MLMLNVCASSNEVIEYNSVIVLMSSLINLRDKDLKACQSIVICIKLNIICIGWSSYENDTGFT